MQTGLTDKEVLKSREINGTNKILRKKQKSIFIKFFENLNDPIIKILLIALGVNFIFIFSGVDWIEIAGIATAILAATIISTISERGSENAFQKLQEKAVKMKSTVIRNGIPVQLPSEDIVVGDLIKLQEGVMIPADGMCIEGELAVDQSMLNGETKEAKKHAVSDTRHAGTDLLNANRLFSGTLVCAGQGTMKVTAVGGKSFYGNIAAELQDEKRESPLKKRLARLAGIISKIGYIGAALVALAYLFNTLVIDNNFDGIRITAAIKTPAILAPKLLQAVTLAISVIVMAVPEGLPMMIAVALSANMKRMLKDNVLIRKPVGIETAGSLNILFTDKTGTLTKGKLQVTNFIDGTGQIYNDPKKLYKQPLWQYLYLSIYYNSLASMSKGKAIGGNSTDRALLEYVSRCPSTHTGIQKKNVIPFSSTIKFMSTEITGNENFTLIKGAPDIILPHCTSYINGNGKTEHLSNRDKLSQTVSGYEKEAARLIAVALSDKPVTKRGNFSNLTLVGLLAIRDDLRFEAGMGVKQIQNAGIQVVMITGDAKTTAEAIARKSGIVKDNRAVILTSEELNRIADDELADILPNLCVVARALPGDKSRLVDIAQRNGLVTGMTGDGVNDTPALKRADVGFVLGSGTETAKEAGDIVILDDNLLSIVKAVKYGRTIFKSIRKFIIYQLTLNFTAMGISMIAPLFGIDAPITIIQMLWLNMVMDTLAGLAFAGELARIDYMKEKPKKLNELIVNKYMVLEITLGGLYGLILSLCFLLNTRVSGMFIYDTVLHMYTLFFALFMFSGIFTGLNARTHRINLFDHLAGNKPFIIIMGLISIIQVFILYYGGKVFRTDGLTIRELAYIILLSSTILTAALFRKILYRICGLKTGT